jgi:DNA repair exonuclease SbcCD nuclease subunit
MASKSEVVIVHSSDLHLGSDSAGVASPDRVAVLHQVLSTADAVEADVVVLAGDTFDHNRQPVALVDQVAQIMGYFRAPIVILPGNHDPLTPDSVYRNGSMSAAGNVCILGLTVDEAVVFPELDLEIWGRAHFDYLDMLPLDSPRSRSTRWQVAAAHGHYVEEPKECGRLLGSWLIRREELLATGADYVALGHWNRAVRVGEDGIHAYYSGCPDYTGTVNVVRLAAAGAVEVARSPLIVAA